MEDFILMLKSEFANLVEEHLDAASNEHLWALGSDDPESAAQHEAYAEHNRELAEFYSKLAKNTPLITEVIDTVNKYNK